MTDEFETQSDDGRDQEYVQPRGYSDSSNSDSDFELEKEIKQPKRPKKGRLT
jgi:hypothetical protein